ncbi:MAG: hypothetical protein ACP5LA_05560 [Thermoplasmata archaeon]|nr:hypothetical protein [Thermoplasmata archaeon]
MEKISFIESVFSSLAGAGPLVNFAILISYAYFYAGNLMFISFVFSFFLYLFFMNTIYQLSRYRVGKGAYYLFLKENNGLKNFIYVYFIYIFFSFASLIIFLIFILIPSLLSIFNIYLYILLFLIIISLTFLIKNNFKSSIIYISIGSFLEILFILIFSIFLFFISKGNYSTLFLKFKIGGIFVGSLFSVLVFAGIGSPISFGDKIENPFKNVKKSIFVSSLIEGVVFILASLSISHYLAINQLSLTNTEIPVFTITYRFHYFLIFFIILLINSFFSILVIYGISLTRTLHKVYENTISYDKSVYFSFIIITILILFFLYLMGPLNSFLLATSIATFNWIIFHDVLNVALIKRFYEERKGLIKNFLFPLFAIIFSFLIFYFIFISLTFPFYLAPLSTVLFFLIYFILKIFPKNIKNY